MYNWSTDLEKLKNYPEQYKIWKLEQLINFGLGGEKLSRKSVEENLHKLHIDQKKRDYFKFLLDIQ
ncbi:hypothetical protein A2716_02380 [candidate division WWE3 bacterium RIFCSPHIGHO2_01_FULL_40_23]|uniref:Uncharacterized protein n=1 Tax=candidate division WWE3 bacterium RIFCSPLOWO2_01_FULL_41_18 TaxID=1802625 RepID=A0A1F4VEZ2_UNCKA|nr:MAG: hypothetical protein A2716_02380 [candidate division WWE3 bacterium RIFCSPHIGHO2_01_FULL_40_23]OGC55832.1 MAG: hypothetical protein A3A78_02230 [candidate division WWE3 bacterium RIFCSPLOWO2_01_FULL_41_18]